MRSERRIARGSGVVGPDGILPRHTEAMPREVDSVNHVDLVSEVLKDENRVRSC